MAQDNASTFGTADLLPRLTTELGYPTAGARLISEKLMKCNASVRAAFWQWWNTNSLDANLEIEGYTLARLMDEHGMKPIAAFLTLDWLQREPEKAKESLARGHDQIISK